MRCLRFFGGYSGGLRQCTLAALGMIVRSMEETIGVHIGGL